MLLSLYISRFVNISVEATETLSADKHPSIHLVIPLRQQLIKLSQPDPYNCDAIAKLKEFQNYYGVMPKPMCQKCGTNDNVIPSVRGKPSQELAMYAEEGYVKLSGCTTTHTGWCKKCEQWTG
ncbi:unnamed protein product [Didymodactylos carnosus]|uniref:Uncharacterized protein n=1 Tax=Didymodactylos carnosus TaxID=1234261 RepID=A0A815UFX3_9BILA|nr:unnamed protein product [Didymodactylos carnosus]CAF4378915.1 unnamed protein product [Didymodactylos carnosus]